MVYITPELFGVFSPDTRHSHKQPALPTFWPVMASPQQTLGLGKRKRQGGEDEMLPAYTHQHCTHTSGRDSSARPQSHNTPPFHTNTNANLSYAIYPITQHNNTTERRPVKQLKRIGHRAKSVSHVPDVQQPDSHRSHNPSHAVADLRPCHACKSAPKRRRELENYLDCRCCSERTCFVCARQCIGGCSKPVCKKCTIEVGEEGDSWCLDCYARNLNS